MTGKLLALLEVAQILHDTGLNQRSVYLYMSTTEGGREWYGAWRVWASGRIFGCKLKKGYLNMAD
jgi:hypothetical protein